ncbi:MAG: hypothetical protein HYX89_04765, partial [Chloroflexi bacterium]|nr:hypothetical protein [Chloroflexota bacterium]
AIDRLWDKFKRDLNDEKKIQDVKEVDNSVASRPFAWHAGLIGLLERFMYTSAVLVGRPEFIAVWLALKVAGQWAAWRDPWLGRPIYNLVLIGNALSIIFGAGGGYLARYLLGW